MLQSEQEECSWCGAAAVCRQPSGLEDPGFLRLRIDDACAWCRAGAGRKERGPGHGLAGRSDCRRSRRSSVLVFFFFFRDTTENKTPTTASASLSCMPVLDVS